MKDFVNFESGALRHLFSSTSGVFQFLAALLALPTVTYFSMLQKLNVAFLGYDVYSFSKFCFGFYGLAVFSLMVSRVSAFFFQLIFVGLHGVKVERRIVGFLKKHQISDPASVDRYELRGSKLQVQKINETLSGNVHGVSTFVVFFAIFPVLFAGWTAIFDVFLGLFIFFSAFAMVDACFRIVETRASIIEKWWKDGSMSQRQERVDFMRDYEKWLATKKMSSTNFLSGFVRIVRAPVESFFAGKSQALSCFPLLVVVPLGFVALKMGEGRAEYLLAGDKVLLKLSGGAYCGPVLLSTSEGYLIGGDVQGEWAYIPVSEVFEINNAGDTCGR